MKANPIDNIVSRYGNDPTRLMDILIDVQDEMDCISDESIQEISELTGISQADVTQTLTFYHFLSKTSRGKYTVYLNDSVVSNMFGRQEVAESFEKEAECKFGEVSKDGLIGLFHTSCIGMNDQEPAAIINNRVFTRLTPFKVRRIVEGMRNDVSVDELFTEGLGDGKNSTKEISSVVNNHIMLQGPILSDHVAPEDYLKKALSYSPEEVIDEVKKSNIRGRGGAGFPTGLKWEFCRRSPDSPKYIFCNADEGEPGTFKDRVMLTEKPDMVIAGMIIGAYAIGASLGILYLRYEYKYLQKHLEGILDEFRKANLLGEHILGKDFSFDIRIQFGAGAYVCGEESALIESAEGKRGEPRDRPPFPVEKGYLQKPTVVNNVETFCAVAKIVMNGGDWYRGLGTSESTGTKVLSISGDCRFPGIYEVEWGFNVRQVLEMAGATINNVQAVQVGGPSGTCLAPSDFDRTLGYEDLATGGSFIIIGKNRNLLEDVILNFTDFFIEESCGSCTPCRALTPILRNKLVKIIEGRGVLDDIKDIKNWSKIMQANRCGLGQTAMRPILTSLKNFKGLYLSKIQDNTHFDSGFRLKEAMKEGLVAADR